MWHDAYYIYVSSRPGRPVRMHDHEAAHAVQFDGILDPFVEVLQKPAPALGWELSVHG